MVIFVGPEIATGKKNSHMNVFIYKGTFANKDFENKKLTLLGVV